MKRTDHAQQITDRFRNLVEQSGDTLSPNHYDELSLLIEAGIDSALVDQLESVAGRLDKMSHELRHDAEFFED